MRAVLFVFPLISLFGFISQEAQARGGQCGGFYGPPMYSSPAMYSGPARYYGPPAPYAARPAYMAAPATPYAQANRQPGYSDQPAYSVPRDGRAPQPQARTAPAATTVEIGAYDNRFEPQTMNVAPGTTVRWTNRGQHAHTVTSSEGRWDSGDITPGATYAATFQQPGTYYYYCRHHQQDRMQGTIVVGGGGAAPSGRPGGAGTSGY